MLNQTTLLMSGLAAALGCSWAPCLLLGGGAKADARLHLPVKLPLGARGLVTTSEHEVWTWLRHTFHDHVVMVKVPVSRFTLSRDGEEQKHAMAGTAQWGLHDLHGLHNGWQSSGLCRCARQTGIEHGQP